MSQRSRFLAIGSIALLAAVAFGDLARPALSQGQTQAQHHPHPGRRPRLWRPERLRPGAVRDARLDRLAREGIRFTHYYSGSTVCAPSRAALMTGMHTGHAWIRGNGDIPLRPEDVTVAMLLRDAGYRTAVIGKWGLGRRDDRAAGQEGLRLLLRVPGSSARAPAVHRSSLPQRRARARPISIATTSTICSRAKPSRSSRGTTRSRSSSISTTPCRTPSCGFRRTRSRRSRDASRRSRSSTPRPTPVSAGATPDGRLARLPVAADAARGVRGDDHAHGPRHRRLTDRPRRAQDRSSARSSCSSATTVRTRRAAPIPRSSRAPAACAGSSATSTRAASACR